MKIRKAIPLLLVLLLLAAACRGGKQNDGGSSGAGVQQVPAVSGSLVLTGESTLDLVSQGKRTVIFKAPSATAYFEYPVFSPDGKMIAYVLATTPTGQGQD